MRIGLVIYGSLDTLSGGYLYDRKLVRHLESMGDEVEVISLPWRGYAGRLLQNFDFGLRRRLEALEIDCLLQDELNHPSLFLSNRLIKARVRYPIFSIVHHLRISERHAAVYLPLYRLVERRYLQTVDGFIFNSRATRETVEDLLGRKTRGLIARPGGDRLAWDISDTEISARAEAPGPLSILFLGNVSSRKNLHTVLETMHLLPPESWQLHIVGDTQVNPAYAKKLEKKVVKMGWKQKVHFYGPVRDELLVDIMRTCQVLLLPSFHEGFGIAYLESMAMGLPALGSDAGGAREIIRHGHNGYLVHPEDSTAVAEHLGRLYEDRELLNKLAVQARRHFVRHPTWQESMAGVRSYLTELI